MFRLPPCSPLQQFNRAEQAQRQQERPQQQRAARAGPSRLPWQRRSPVPRVRPRVCVSRRSQPVGAAGRAASRSAARPGSGAGWSAHRGGLPGGGQALRQQPVAAAERRERTDHPGLALAALRPAGGRSGSGQRRSLSPGGSRHTGDPACPPTSGRTTWEQRARLKAAARTSPPRKNRRTRAPVGLNPSRRPPPTLSTWESCCAQGAGDVPVELVSLLKRYPQESWGEQPQGAAMQQQLASPDGAQQDITHLLQAGEQL